ncbi:hypothetical protein DSUL_150094 [Desulfovibrionales bacterium]
MVKILKTICWAVLINDEKCSIVQMQQMALQQPNERKFTIATVFQFG